MNERHGTRDLTTNKNFFANNYTVDIFLFITAVITVLVTFLAIYLLCKHRKLRLLVTNLTLQQVKEVGAVTQKKVNTESKILTCICLVLTNIWPSDGYISALQKSKIVQRMHVL